MQTDFHNFCCESQVRFPNDVGVDRRGFIKGLMAAVAVGLSDVSFADANTDARFVLIVLRGGMDGLNVVVPYADKHYAVLRKQLAYLRPDDDDSQRSTLDLDGYFGLHPALKNVYPLYQQGDLAFVHATSTPYRQRSHFDGQDMFENGSNMTLGGPEDGWLNRTLALLGNGDTATKNKGNKGNKGAKGVSVGKTTPYVIRGDTPFLSLNPNSDLHVLNPDIVQRIQQLYTGTQHPVYGGGDFSMALSQALDSSDLLQALGADRKQRSAQVKQLAGMAGETLAMQDGPRIATMSIGGWDTHADQPALLAESLTNLSDVILRLKSSLGQAWHQTTIACVSEFGRMVHTNGTDGTDHGTGGCAVLAGGALNGTKVYGTWPTLNPDTLFEGRDVYPTSDVRCVLAEILHSRFAVSTYDLETKVFPSMTYTPMGVVS